MNLFWIIPLILTFSICLTKNPFRIIFLFISLMISIVLVVSGSFATISLLILYFLLFVASLLIYLYFSINLVKIDNDINDEPISLLNIILATFFFTSIFFVFVFLIKNGNLDIVYFQEIKYFDLSEESENDFSSIKILIFMMFYLALYTMSNKRKMHG